MRKQTSFLVYPLLLIMGVFIFFANSCKKEDDNNNGGSNAGSFTDTRDGNIYQTVTIGDQVWMAENLRYLPSVVGPGPGSDNTAYYYVYGYYGTDVNAAKATEEYTTYGVLYNWYAACTSCPTGWHLPSDTEWIQLTDYLGGKNVAGDKLKETGTTHWNSPNTDATNETGFSALPGGYRNYNGYFYYIGYNGYWLSSMSALHRAPGTGVCSTITATCTATSTTRHTVIA